MLEKIKKLLRLAASDNPHEAALALQRAQELMQKHHITEQDIKLSEIKEQAANAYSAQKITSIEATLARCIADLFGCEYLFDYKATGYGIRTMPIFIGLDPHQEIAAYAYETTHRKLMRARREHIATLSKRMKRHNKTRKADAFCLGWVGGIREKVEKLVPTTKPTDLINQYRALHYPDTVNSGTRDANKKRNKKDLMDMILGHIAADSEQINAGVGHKETLTLNH